MGYMYVRMMDTLYIQRAGKSYTAKKNISKYIFRMFHLTYKRIRENRFNAFFWVIAFECNVNAFHLKTKEATTANIDETQKKKQKHWKFEKNKWNIGQMAAKKKKKS